MRQVTRWFRALSDPGRIRILNMLSVRPLAVCEIREVLGLAVSTVSKHLFILREAGFLVDEKEGKWVNYRLDWESMEPAQRKLVELLLDQLRDDPIAQQDRERAKTVDRFVICQR